MIKSYPLSSRFTVFVFIPALIGLGYLINLHSSSLPTVDTEVTVAGIEDEINITRDINGVAYINAKTDSDAFFAVGFVHAQDRMWQLEIQRRISQGRLSELLGSSTVNIDLKLRTLGIYQHIDEAWNALSDNAKRSLTAYTAGINQWLSQNKELPIEFSLLGVKPEPWREIDSLAWIKLFALNLSDAINFEIHHLVAARYLNEPQLQEFFPSYPAEGPTTISESSDTVIKELSFLREINRTLESNFNIGGTYVGSNAWAISGALTTSGNALLANDPHTALQIPSIWYAIDINGENVSSRGMSLVGLPLVIFGRNDDIAWAGTNLMMDDQDLFYEEVNPNNFNQYRHDGEWKNFSSRKEKIHVRTEFPSMLHDPYKPLEITIRETINGPVVTDLFSVSKQPISLKWTGKEKKDTSYESFFKLNYATNWLEFRDAASFHVAPGLNMLFADNKGNIGYSVFGRIPIRDNWQGFLPVSGSGDNNWTGYVTTSENPHVFNPKEGYVISANNKPVAEHYPYFISNHFAPPERASRIQAMLQEGLKATDTDLVLLSQQVQMDVKSESTRNVLAAIAPHMPTEKKYQDILEVLKGWNGEMTENSSAATLYHVWMKFTRQKLFSDELTVPFNQSLDNSFTSSLVSAVSPQTLVKAFEPGGIDWCDVQSTEALETCREILSMALDSTIQELSKLKSDDVDDWAWSEVHFSVYPHMVFNQDNMFKSVFSRKVFNIGGTDTVNVSGSSFKLSAGYEQNFGATHRQVMTLGKSEEVHLYMNSTGQSGNPFSDHYDDMIEPFQRGEYASFEAPSKSEGASWLTLIPTNN
ncbi:Acyl-homoserine lactone acylase QuiP precursor [Pseudoalteromonas sp. P1-9]|uniref:penicillin acylase family protein n=1 Tax=Pseudoalteromonas sp. P1-9 TaxID=1710354 RepID=UPI0006D5E556|nr:penicillin acylase family protein [Pseudoalteromonas sp. P1-9]KPV93759.1 Acyl-homoserine lactone acylase QuiP precursor [Pseudoalteromonas sp. P1-9]